jgi:hypothetical protein
MKLPNDPGDTNHNLGATHTLAEVQAKLNNPLSNLWSLQLQNTWQINSGAPSTGTRRTAYSAVFQPAMPVPLTKDWTWISRPVFTALSSPEFDSPTYSWDRANGVGEMTYETWLTPSKSSKITWGLGGAGTIPLTTREELTSGKYSIGPSGVAVYMDGHWIVGTLTQYQWSVSGSDKREPVSQLSMQYFVNYLLPNHWQFTMSPTITYNKKADGPDAWAVPVGVGIGKMVKVGKLPMKLQLEFDAYPIHHDSFGPRYAIKFSLTPVIPALIKKPLF